MTHSTWFIAAVMVISTNCMLLVKSTEFSMLDRAEIRRFLPSPPPGFVVEVLKSLKSQYSGVKIAYLSLALAVLVFFQAAVDTAVAQSEIVFGTFTLPEISGAVMVGDRLLVAADDAEQGNKFHMVDLLGNALMRLKKSASIAPKKEEQIYKQLLHSLPVGDKGEPDSDLITDLEDIAPSPQGDIYLISSHSRNKKDKLPPKRQQLLRVHINADTGVITDAALSKQSLLEALPEELKEATKRRPGARDTQGTYTPGSILKD